MRALLTAVRRRLRLAWLVATAQLVAPVVAAAALVLVVVGRLRPWAWPEPTAAAVAAASAVTLVVAACALRIPEAVAARAADRGLGTGDVFVTALELPPTAAGPLLEQVRARAGDLARARRASDAVPLRIRPRRVTVVVALAAAAAGLAMVANHQDDVRRQREAEKDMVRAEAEQLRKAADELARSAGTPGQQDVARRLEELARDVGAAGNLEQGQAAVDQVARDLAQRLSPDLVAQKAAVRGLDRTLAATPLPQAGTGDAASQLRQLASALDRLGAGERATLADRLDALAGTQTAGDPDAARALNQAAAALRSGDLAAARSALEAAAGAQSATTTSVEDQEAAVSALATVAASSARLTDAAAQGEGAQGQGQGRGQGAGQGQGQGQGQGAGQGQGQGQGQGRGQGAGQGQGQGTGSPSGQVGGTNAATGSGQGGAGTPRGTGNNRSVGLQEATVFDPPRAGNNGEQLNVTGQLGEGPSQAAGRGNTSSSRNQAQVPLAQVLPRYQAEATAALQRLGLPPSQRALVQAYFAALAGS